MTQQPNNAASENTTRKLTASGWLVRIFLYGCVVFSGFLPLSVHYSEQLWNRHLEPFQQSNARHFLDEINRGQMAHYIGAERFANAIADLDLRLPTETDAFHYRIVTSMVPVQSQEQASQPPSSAAIAVVIGQAKRTAYKHYIGAVAAIGDRGMMSILCETTTAGRLPTAMPVLTGNEWECPAGSQKV